MTDKEKQEQSDQQSQTDSPQSEQKPVHQKGPGDTFTKRGVEKRG